MSAHRNRHQAIGTREGDGDRARSLDQGRHRHIDRSSRSPEEERPDTGGRGHLSDTHDLDRSVAAAGQTSGPRG